MHMLGTFGLAAAFAAVFAGGIALFTIARQDDSRNGQVIGAASAVVGLVGIVWLFGTRL